LHKTTKSLILMVPHTDSNRGATDYKSVKKAEVASAERILTMPAYIKLNEQIKHTSFAKNRAVARQNPV